MDQTFNTRSNFNECAVVCDNHYFTLHNIADFQVCTDIVPRMGSKLLQTKSNSLLLIVEVEYNHIDFFVQLNDFIWMCHTAPAKVGDVDQTIYATEVNEYTIRGDVLDSSFKNLAFFKFGDDVLFLLFQFGLNKGLVRNHHVSEFMIDFDNLEFHGFPYVDIVVADRFHIDLRSRQEGLDSEYIDDHTAFRTAFDESGNNFVIFEGSIDTIPAAHGAGLFVGKG